MPIKQSFLEKKWYYRVAKVFFTVLPILVVAWFLFQWRGFIPSLTQKSFAAMLQNNTVNIVYGIIALIAYILIIKWGWRAILYVGFGGLENDVQKKTNNVAAVSVEKTDKKDLNEIGSLVGLLIIIGCIYYAYFIYQPHNNIVPSPSPTPKCVSTGCGNQWRCNGTYYVSDKQIRVDSCYLAGSRPRDIYSSWSGICRQCP